MSVDPRGSLSLAEVRLRETLAALPAFQEFAGVTSADDAAAHIFRNDLPPHAANQSDYSLEELRQYRPFAILWTQRTGNGFSWSNRPAFGTTRMSGRLLFDLEREIPERFNHVTADEDADFCNLVGLIADELAAVGYLPGGMPIEEVTVVDGPARNDPKNYLRQGRLQGATILVQWGVGVDV